MKSYRYRYPEQILQQPRKIFVIGLGKTATTTIHSLFLINGLRSQHATKWDLDDYDCFTDGCPSIYTSFSKLNEQFHNSIFILNTRSLRKMLISRFNHGYTKYNKLKVYNWAYPYSEDMIIKLINHYNEHYVSVLNYFKGISNKLIIIDIDQPNWELFLSRMLNLPKSNIEPQNIIPRCEEYDEIVRLVDTTLEKINGKCILKETNQLDHLLKLYRNNLGKPV